MMLDLKALEKALATIGNVGKGEITFTVDGSPVSLRVLTADEEVAVQKFASDSEGEDKDSEGLTFLERYKRATLAHAIIQVGEFDLRGAESIPTGEVHPETGVPLRVSKHVAVRKIVDGWARVATLALFQKYLELLRRVDAAAERSIEFKPGDLDAEIARVEKRLAGLKAEKARADEAKTGIGSKVAALVAEADRGERDRAANLAAHAAGEVKRPEVTLSPEPPETPIVTVHPPVPPVAPPTAAKATPPEEGGAPAAAAAPRQRVGPRIAPPPMPPPPPPAPVAPPEASTASRFEQMQDSFGDSDDAVASETQRLLAARAAARNASQEALRTAETTVVPGRREPPHRAAANTADAVFDAGAGGLTAARPAGKRDDVEAFRLPAEHLTDRERKPARTGQVPVNRGPSDAPNNPRFVGKR